MTTMLDIQTALANEARRVSLTAQAAQLQGVLDTVNTISTNINSIKYNAQQQKSAVDASLVSITSSTGPGITADFGPKSVIDQFLDAERYAAKSATIDFIKANPTCTEQEAANIWNTAAIASHPEFIYAVQEGLVMGKLYQVNLTSRLFISSPTWENQRTWITATAKDVIMEA